MNLFLTHFSLAVVLFVILNWIGKHSIHAGYIRMSVIVKADEAPAFNFIYRAFSPVAYITIISALCYALQIDWVVRNIYLVVVYYFIFRVSFNILTGRGKLLNWLTQLAYIMVSVPMSYYVYDTLITHKEFLLPTTKELGSAVWLAIVAYVYHTFNSIKLSDERTKARKKNYLQDRYNKYKNIYGRIIEEVSETKQQEALIYAVLIIEAFNRPKVYRIAENIFFKFGLAKTLGIMQVTTNVFINDMESVRLGANKIVADHLQAKLRIEARGSYDVSWSIRNEVLTLYNPDTEYVCEVNDLYREIVNVFYQNEIVELDS